MSPRFFKILQAEVRNYRRKPQARRWTKEELADMESMRARGPRAFRGLPFTKPSRKTLRGTWSHLHLRPGANKHILEMLKAKVAAMPEQDKLCYVVFDEMSLRRYLSLLRKADMVSGFVDLGTLGHRHRLAEEVLVCMVRSVYGTWKLPVSFWYTDKKLDASDFASLFLESIQNLLETGLDVRAMVTDGLQKNIAAENILGATSEKPCFFVGTKKIVTIVDVPHLLKSMRNALLKYLPLRPDGTYIDITFIKAFLLQDLEKQVRMAPKVSWKHVDPNNFEKMNVGMAARLLHTDVAAGVMAHVLTGALPPEAMATGKYCEEMHTFFQSFQGILYNENPEPNDFSCALSANSSHIQLWDKMILEMERWEFLGSDRVMVMRNWRTTMRAFKELWADLQQEGCKYLPVGHMNQDCQENFFSLMRFNGGHLLNPSAIDIPSAFMRSFVQNLTSGSKGKNCRDDEAVNLVNLEELIQALEQAKGAPEQKDIPGPGLQQELDIEMEEEDENLWFSDKEGGQDHVSDWLESTASSKAAAPIVNKFLAKVDSAECKNILQTDSAEFPLHLHHIMMAGPSNQEDRLPTSMAAKLVRDVRTACNEQLKSQLHKPKILEGSKGLVSRLPSVTKFSLCAAHNDLKSDLLDDICLDTVQALLKQMNLRFRDRTPKQQAAAPPPDLEAPGPARRRSGKLQRVSHL